jgi:putative ATP-dependent endonuclease of OLD family
VIGEAMGRHMTLQISRVRISNFRNFAELDIDPFPAPAVIVGENGVGKSNFLYALRLILDPDLPDSARQLKPEDIHEGAAGPFGPGLPGGAEVEIEVEFSGFDDDQDAIAVLSGAITQITAPMRAALKYRFAPRSLLELDDERGTLTDRGEGSDGRIYKASDYDFRVIKGDDPTTDAARIRRLVSLRVLPALRDAESDLSRWNRSPLRTLLEDLDLDPARLAAVAADIDAAASKLAVEPQVDDLQKRLADRLQKLVGPRLPVAPTVGVASSRPELLLRGLRLFVDAARTRGVTDISLGAANVLYLGMLMEALAVRRAASAFVTTMLGVEEPEAHLHVGIQRRLFRHLLDTEPALLLTTHSPHITAVAPLDSLVLLRADHGETIASSTLRAGLDSAEQRDISRYLDTSRAELLFARVVLLVEGVAEVFMLPAIASAAGFDLDEQGVAIVNVAGTDFAPYVKLLGDDGLDIPHAILTDGDPLRTSDRREQGLGRAAALLTDAATRERVTIGVAMLIQLEDDHEWDEAHDMRRSLQQLCAGEGIYVGDETLEIDLLPLIGVELLAAYEELVPQPKRRANMARDIVALMKTSGAEPRLGQKATALISGADPEPQAKTGWDQRVNRLLGRIEDRGKGRVAQRLADHVSVLNLRTRVLELLKARDAELRAGGRTLDVAHLRQTGSPQATLRILNWASLVTRHQPLFDEAP